LEGLLAGSSLYQSSLKHKNQYRAVPHRRSSPSRYVLWSVAPLRLFVVDLPNLTSQISRFLSVEANVESLTIGGVGVLGVDNQLSVGVRLFRLGALEPILQLVGDVLVASLSSSRIRPDAGSGELVEVQTGGAGDLGVFSLDAVVELVANGGLGVGEEAVTSGAVVVRFGGLQLGTVSAVDVEGLVAFVDFADQGVEDQAVGAELLDGDAVLALVEFVTLAGVFVLAVFRGALELRIGCGN
jgi:hypothetical protein